MLTLKQIKAEMKKRNVAINDGDDEWEERFEHYLTIQTDSSNSAFIKYMKQAQAFWEANQKRTEEYYAKYYPTRPYKRPPMPGEGYWKQRFREDQYTLPGTISFSVGTSTYSCAIPEFGGFELRKGKLADHWDLLIQFYVVTSKSSYYKCAIPTTKTYAPVRNGLVAAGFELRATEKGSHGNYGVEVWEFIKKATSKRKKK